LTQSRQCGFEGAASPGHKEAEIDLSQRGSIHSRKQRNRNPVRGQRKQLQAGSHRAPPITGIGRRRHLELLQRAAQMHRQVDLHSFGNYRTVCMQIHPIAIVLSPPQMTKTMLLVDGAGQILDGGACMLLLAGVNDRPGAESLQHPPHRAEIRGRYLHYLLLLPNFCLDYETAVLLNAIIPNTVGYDLSAETGYRNEAPATP
jgi:hypothetical protein